MNYGKKQVQEKIDHITNPAARQKIRFKMFLVSLLVCLFFGGVLFFAIIVIGSFS